MNEKIKENLKVIIIALAIAIFACIPYLQETSIDGDDISYHISRFASIAEEFKLGNFPIAIHSSLLEGLGYANSIFYPELFLYIPALLLLCGLEIFKTYTVFIIIINFATVLITYYSAKHIFKIKEKAWITTLMYTLATYRLGDIFVRAALGEVIAFTFLPLILAGLYEIIIGDNKKWWLVCFGIWGIVNSHIITCALMLVCIMLICLMNIKRIFADKSRLKNLFIAGIVSIVFAIGFLLPYLEQKKNDDFKMDVYNNSFYLYDSASTLQELLGDKLEGIGDTFSKGLFILFIPLLIFKCKKIDYKKDPFIIQCFILGVISLILSTKLMPWKYMGFLQIIQFPFRFSTLTMLFMSFVIGYVVSEVFETKDAKYILMIIFIFMVSKQLYAVNPNVSGLPGDQIIKRSQIGAEEYLPVNFDYKKWYVFNLETPKDKIKYSQTGNRIEFDYNDSEHEFKLHVPLTYYKGYVAKIETTNGETIDLNLEKDNEYGQLIISYPEKISGKVIVEYKNTGIQIFAVILKIVSITGLTAYVIYSTKKEKNTNVK